MDRRFWLGVVSAWGEMLGRSGRGALFSSGVDSSSIVRSNTSSFGSLGSTGVALLSCTACVSQSFAICSRSWIDRTEDMLSRMIGLPLSSVLLDGMMVLPLSGVLLFWLR